MKPKEYQLYKFKQQLKDFLTPSYSAIFMYFVIGFLILTILNFDTIRNIVFGNSIIGTQDITLYSDRLSAVWSWLGNIIVWVFWGIVGLTIYAVIWLIQNVIEIGEEEEKESQYVKQNISVKKSYWQTTMSSNILLVSLVFIWLAYTLFFVWLHLGLLSNLLVNGLYNFPQTIAIFYLVFSILMSAFLVYIFQLVSELAVHSWRIIKPQQY